MKSRQGPAAGELQPTLHSHVNINIYTTNLKIDHGVDGYSWTRLKSALDDTTRQKKKTCQHGSNPTHSLDPSVVGGGLQPSITRCPKAGKPTTHSYLRESDQTSVTGWNELSRLAWDC
jgi:hypothetical protein